jgi:hypothetical protein
VHLNGLLSTPDGAFPRARSAAAHDASSDVVACEGCDCVVLAPTGVTMPAEEACEGVTMIAVAPAGGEACDGVVVEDGCAIGSPCRKLSVAHGGIEGMGGALEGFDCAIVGNGAMVGDGAVFEGSGCAMVGCIEEVFGGSGCAMVGCIEEVFGGSGCAMVGCIEAAFEGFGGVMVGCIGLGPWGGSSS